MHTCCIPVVEQILFVQQKTLKRIGQAHPRELSWVEARSCFDQTGEAMMDAFTLFAGTANPVLAAGIARELGVRLGACAIERFPDGEISMRLGKAVRGREVFILQPTSPPVNDHLIELLACADACRRASAVRITAIVPYFGYARSDKRHG